MPVRRGSCLCNEINYEVTGEPYDVNVCHCNACQKCTGSTFSINAFFKPENVKVTKGKMTEWIDRDTRSGIPLIRKFCPSCGSNVLVADWDRGFVIVDAGTVNTQQDWRPKWEKFPEDRKDWVKIIL